MLYRFKSYELDTQRYELRKAGELVALRPKALDLLVYLVDHAGQVISKQEFIEHLWPGRDEVVSDAMLNGLVMQVRQAVADNGTDQQIIQTKRGRGFCFIATVEVITEEVGDTSRSRAFSVIPENYSMRYRDLRLWFTMSVAVLLVISISGYVFYSSRSEIAVASEKNMAYPLPKKPSLAVMPLTTSVAMLNKII